MDAHFRKIYNDAFTPEVYQRYLDNFSKKLDVTFEFRNAETPLFLPPEMRDRFATAAREIMAQLQEPARLAKMMRAVPDRWRVPNLDQAASFVQIDFAVVRAPDGTLVPRLIELQGFPSLTAMQVIKRDMWAEAISTIPGLDRDWSCWFSGLNRERFIELAKKTILGNQDPRHVVLMDLDPPHQKTFPDFRATKLLFDVDAICPTALIKQGKKLFRRIDPKGELIPVKRIYNRVVFDELEKKNPALPFDYREELEVEWAPHPNWFWIWSKYSLPLLDHPAVPKSRFVDQLTEIPEDLETRYVLKPLFSFAGGGVNVQPKVADLDKIPEAERPFWCLQERVDYEPALFTPEGAGVKVEIRMMFLKPDGEKTPILAQNLTRLSRGLLHGVDFNKNFTWVGSTMSLWPAGS